MIGVFPPPLMGMATINDAMRQYISGRGLAPIVINMTYRSLSKAWHVRIRRLIQLPAQLVRFVGVVFGRKVCAVYMSISAGYGQWFEIPFVLLARLAGKHLMMHHHSMLYINRPTFISRVMMRLAGSGAMHIVLCECMAESFRASYGSVASLTVLSNASFLPAVEAHERVEVKTLGFLSNIEPDKGIMEFLELVQLLESSGQRFRALVAGPFRDPDVEQLVRNRIEELESVSYVGPKYDAEKSDYFSSIDVLLYPTKNDAEPLTVLEAMAHGVPVIANSRGCIGELLEGHAGLVVTSDDDFVHAANEQLLVWKAAPERYVEVTFMARERFAGLKKVSLARLGELFPGEGIVEK